MVAMAVRGGTNFLRHHEAIGDRFEWDATMLPKGKCERGIRVSCDGFMIYSGTKYPDLAWELLQLMVSKEANELRFLGGALPPARRSMMPTFEASMPQYNLKTIGDALEEARADPRAVWAGGSATWNVIAPYYEQCFILNKISVEEAMKQAVAEVHKQKPWEK